VEPSSEGLTSSSGLRVIKNMNGRFKFSEGEILIFRGPLDPVDQWRG
jgi:hypothetical protein